MTTTADAIEVMTIVAACHHRTAPRMDDREAIIATATVWAELFTAHDLHLPDLVAAVKKRATAHTDAPEPAEIIAFARGIRQARDADAGPSPAYEAMCEAKAEDAAELAEHRRIREMQPAIERPMLRELVAGLATSKGAVL